MVSLKVIVIALWFVTLFVVTKLTYDNRVGLRASLVRLATNKSHSGELSAINGRLYYRIMVAYLMIFWRINLVVAVIALVFFNISLTTTVMALLLSFLAASLVFVNQVMGEE